MEAFLGVFSESGQSPYSQGPEHVDAGCAQGGPERGAWLADSPNWMADLM